MYRDVDKGDLANIYAGLVRIWEVACSLETSGSKMPMYRYRFVEPTGTGTLRTP